jgi:hypothetical protein
VAYPADAAARIVIVETTSTGTALGISKAMPSAVTGLLVGWMALCGHRAKRRGESAGQVGRDAGAHGRVSRDSITNRSDEPAANRSADPPPRHHLASRKLGAAIRPPARQPAGVPRTLGNETAIHEALGGPPSSPRSHLLTAATR